MTTNTVILFGPQHSGKTLNRDHIAAHYGCTSIVDDWNKDLVMTLGGLHITSEDLSGITLNIINEDGKFGDVKVVHIGQALMETYGVEGFVPPVPQSDAAQKIMLSSKYGKMGNLVDFAPDFSALAREIHADNVKVGWWTNIQTGESTLTTRNRPEMLMLSVSELAEAAQGAQGMADDKLKHLPMYDVELADFAIRQFDQIGAEVSVGATMPSFGLMVPTKRLRPMSRSDRLMHLVGEMAAAMENYRKGRIVAYMQCMADAVFTVFQISEIEGIDLLDIIRQKRAFNATRADHQVANRLKEGGKAF